MPKFITIPTRGLTTALLDPRSIELERTREQRRRDQHEVLIWTKTKPHFHHSYVVMYLIFWMLYSANKEKYIYQQKIHFTLYISLYYYYYTFIKNAHMHTHTYTPTLTLTQDPLFLYKYAQFCCYKKKKSESNFLKVRSNPKLIMMLSIRTFF